MNDATCSPSYPVVEVTRLASSSGPLTKRISLSPGGTLVSDGSACVMSRGSAWRVPLAGAADLGTLIGSLEPHEAIALGALRPDLPEKVAITTARQLAKMGGETPAGTIARTAGHIAYAPKVPAYALLDYDVKGMPPPVKVTLEALGGFWEALLAVMPDVADAARVVRRSTSSGIYRSDTGENLSGSDGLHAFVLVRDGADIERFLKTLHDRCWLKGLGWMMVGAGGQLLDRSIVDRMVYAGERLVFEGAPILEDSLAQDARSRAPVAYEGDAVDTVAACRELTVVELARLRELKVKERHRLSDAAAASRAAFVRKHASRIAARTGVSQEAAEYTVERQCGGVLLPGVELQFDAKDMAGATVGDVLADPDRFVGATLADPLEGVAYGRCKAKVMRRGDGSLWINSFAHGRIAYELRYDAAAVEAALTAVEPSEAVRVLVKLLPNADLAADDEQRLREMACNLAQVKARPLAAKIKAAHAEQQRTRRAEDRDRAVATRTGSRVRLPVPPPDAEWLPVLGAIDEVLCGVDEPEPPMRDIVGDPVEIRTRTPMLLHELTAVGSNHAKPQRSTRLPAPEMPLLTKHDRYSMAHLVERYIEYETEGNGRSPPRSVALPPGFVDHYMAYRGSALPRVGAIVTTPLVLPDGSLLARQGIDGPRRLVFRIPPELLRFMPTAEALSDERVARAFDYLVNDWLCDVATSFAGKCVLVAMALTILERVLLPERPAFFVTAGKRGGGKTTTLMMVILAVTGKKPPAAAWSSNEEERRKALVAYLGEGLAAMVFDNVPLGTTISCPTVEKILTAETYSDRILGQSATMNVQAFTVLSFTGNNIGPKGDLASRSLVARLDVDRPDPENRPFRHADPVAYTVENRGAILRALYVLLLGNPQLRQPKPAKTRFKAWWHLVGSAVEHAAACLVEAERGRPACDGQAQAEHLDFGAVFRDVEGEDEEAASLGDALDVLKETWPMGYFTSAEVAKMINEPMDGEKERSVRLRAFFAEQAGRRAGSEISAIQIGKRLGKMVDTPIIVDGRTLQLVKDTPKNQAERRLTSGYHVKQI